MPFGGIALGAAYYVGVKYVGYSAAGMQTNRTAQVDLPHPLIFGAARTALGMAVGASYALLMREYQVESAGLIFLLGLIPVRVMEWYAAFWYFYRDRPALWSARTSAVTLGVLWSFALDIPAIFAAFALPGGFWIC